jgi:PHD/YefM family antitoxin component YafN of YafNO toxin-antitoxin module
MGSSVMPVIDPNVKYVGVSKLRELNAAKLKETEDTLVFQDNDQPLAVLLTYSKFMEMQQQLYSLLNTIDLCQEKTELEGLKAAFEDLKEGRVRSLAEIKAELARKK